MAGLLVSIFVFGSIGAAIAAGVYFLYRQSLREAKNYERGLKMIPLRIHLPPSSDDIDAGGRDARDVTQEAISQAQVMYNIIASTATKGFKSKLFGQRHIAFEVTVKNGMVNYYVVVPVVLIDVIRQAVSAAYPAATLEEVEEQNIFSQTGRISGTIGGELTLKNDYSYPIATFEEAKRDAMIALLNALSGAGKDDGAAIQILLRPAQEGWSKSSNKTAQKIRQGKSGKGGSSPVGTGLLEMLWKPPAAGEKKEGGGDHQVSSLEQSHIEAIEEKTRYPAYETLIRVIASSNTATQSQTLVKNVVAAFSLFDAPNKNGFKFSVTNNIEQFTTAFIFRFFPQNIKNNILNSIELATIFHLPDQSSIPTSQVERQAAKQVDGPNFIPDKGLLLGVNVFRGTKKEIRLSESDRTRHTYIIGQTGTGKTGLLENLALQDMLEGRGFAFIDPHGDAAEKLLGMVPKNRVEDVIYFNPIDTTNPIGMNLFEISKDDPDPQRTMDYIISELVNMLYSMYDPGHTGIVGPRMENIVRNAAILVMSDPNGGTFMDIPKILVDPEFAKSKIKYLKNQRAIDFWTKEWPNAQRSNESGEVTSWVVSKWAPFENSMMTNILGQIESGLNLREIMDNKKILLVNLSKGQLGEYSAKLLGTVFVMKFQAAAMARADIPEDQRVDFCLYVDEFQNFATDSFESILSEARKYRLNLIVGNQFITQLSDKVREAIIGNVGTVISGRIGVTDAELLVKRFQPTFDMEDLIKLPNYQSIANVMINNVPSAPFSMNLLPPLGGTNPNPKLADALKKLSAAKHGRPRAEVERKIFMRLGNSAKSLDQATKQIRGASEEPSSGSSFLDEWLAKRKEISAKKIEPSQKPAVKKSKEETITPTAPSPADPTQQDIDTVEHSGDLSVQGSGESDEEVHVAIR